MTTRRIPISHADLYGETDIEEAQRDLATLMASRDEETDPDWCEALDDMIACDTAWLAELIELVRGPVLPLMFPIGLPVPAPGGRDAR